MRAKDRAEVAELVRKHLAPMNDYMAKIMAVLAALGNDVAEIEPVINRVDLTQEMANDIVRKIHGPLTISKEFSEWIRGQAEFKDVYWTTPLGYSAMAGQMELRLKTDGSLYLELRDAYGANMWRGSFVPPDYGVTDEPG